MTASSLSIPSPSDEALAELARSNVEGFTELYRRHFLRVYRYHMARTANPADAQDLTTQTFLAALEGIHSYQGKGNFIAWLLGIARRKLALHYRQASAPAPLEAAGDYPDPAPSPEALVGRNLQLDQVSQALGRLTPERAEAIVLCLLCGLSAAEAAAVMGKNTAAVKMLVFRGLKELRTRLAPIMQEEA
jgi:RNA polymerase sigma-70 factor (ECF subfamily)